VRRRCSYPRRLKVQPLSKAHFHHDTILLLLLLLEVDGSELTVAGRHGLERPLGMEDG
jgi:hypothetical protein